MIKANTPPAEGGPKLLDQVRARIRAKHYSIPTETQYMQWVRRFILFRGKRHPQAMDAAEAAAFLSHLVVEGAVAASTQNQALAALKKGLKPGHITGFLMVCAAVGRMAKGVLIRR